MRLRRRRGLLLAALHPPVRRPSGPRPAIHRRRHLAGRPGPSPEAGPVGPVHHQQGHLDLSGRESGRSDHRVRHAGRSVHASPSPAVRQPGSPAGCPHDMQPRFSPDGKRIVFVSDRSGDDNVWIMSLDGRDTVQLTKGVASTFLSPEWTPDGEYIVVSRAAPLAGNEKLWLYSVHGGTGIPLVDSPDVSAGFRMMGPAFGPDARYVWYAARNGSWQYNAILPQYQIGVYDRKTGDRTTMSSRYGSALPAGGLARREVAGLRLPAGRGDRPADPGPGHRRGALAGLPHPAGRAGIAGDDGRAAGLLVHAGFESRSSCPTAARSGGCRWTAPPRRRSRSR